jgi:hypothetical protein
MHHLGITQWLGIVIKNHVLQVHFAPAKIVQNAQTALLERGQLGQGIPSALHAPVVNIPKMKSLLCAAPAYRTVESMLRITL